MTSAAVSLAERIRECEGHSGGPWLLLDLNRTLQVSTSEAHSHNDAVVFWTGFDSSDLPWRYKRANARLIALAPELKTAYLSEVQENARLRGLIADLYHSRYPPWIEGAREDAAWEEASKIAEEPSNG